MQHKRYKPLGITSAKKPQNTHLWVETDSTGTIYAVDSSDNTNLIKTIDKCANWSIVANRSKAIRALWYDSGAGIIYAVEDNRTTDDITIWKITISTDTVAVIGGDVGDSDFKAIDIWIRDTNLEIHVLDTNFGGFNTRNEIWRWVDPNWTLVNADSDIPGVDGQEVPYAAISGSNAYWYNDDTLNNDVFLIIYDGTDMSLGVALDDYSANANLNYRYIAYDGSNLLFMNLVKDSDGFNYLAEYNISGNSWTVTGIYNTILQLNRNNRGTVPNELEKGFGALDETVYEIKARRGGIVQLQDISALADANITAITDNFLMLTNGKMFEWTEVSNEISEISYRKGIIPILQKGSFIAHPEFEGNWNNGDSIKIYDQFDILEFWGQILNKKQAANGFYNFDIDAFSNEIYRTQYDKDYVGSDLDTKQKDIIDNACSFCYRDSSIVGTTTTFDYKYKRAIAYLLFLGRFLERQIAYIEPDGKVYTEAYNGQTKQPQFYPGTYNFKDDAVGSNPAGWTISEAGGTVNVIAELNGHRKVVELDDTNGAASVSMTQTFTAGAQEMGTVEFWVEGNNVTDDLSILIKQGAINAVNTIIREDKVQYFYAGGFHDATGGGVANNTLHHFKYVFDINTDTYSFYLDGDLLDAAIPFGAVAATGLTNIFITTGSGDSNFKYYIGDVGYSWDPNYNVGDNLVAWELSNHWQNVDLIDIPDVEDIQPGYFLGNTGITRTTVRYRDNTVTIRPEEAIREPIEQLKGVKPLKEFSDPKIEGSTEAEQLGDNLYDMFSIDTKYISVRAEGFGYIEPGRTMDIQNKTQITIARDDYVILQYTRDPKNDRYFNIIFSDNIILTSEFKSFNDQASKQLRTAVVQSFENQADIIAHLTREGGLALRLTNKTGAASIKGTLVEADGAVDNAFNITDASSVECFGVVYEDGVADGEECLIVIGGRVQVLLKDATISTRHNWAQTSDVAGRADATIASPAAAPQHFREIGHVIESKGSGTDVLAYIMMNTL